MQTPAGPGKGPRCPQSRRLAHLRGSARDPGGESGPGHPPAGDAAPSRPALRGPSLAALRAPAGKEETTFLVPDPQSRSLPGAPLPGRPGRGSRREVALAPGSAPPACLPGPRAPPAPPPASSVRGGTRSRAGLSAAPRPTHRGQRGSARGSDAKTSLPPWRPGGGVELRCRSRAPTGGSAATAPRCPSRRGSWAPGGRHSGRRLRTSRSRLTRGSCTAKGPPRPVCGVRAGGGRGERQGTPRLPRGLGQGPPAAHPARGHGARAGTSPPGTCAVAGSGRPAGTPSPPWAGAPHGAGHAAVSPRKHTHPAPRASGAEPPGSGPARRRQRQAREQRPVGGSAPRESSPPGPGSLGRHGRGPARDVNLPGAAAREQSAS